MTPLRHRSGGLPGEFVKFGMVGTAGFCVDAAVLYLCLYGGGMGFYLARLFSYLAAATFTWALNRSFTFNTGRSDPIRSQWARFIGVNAFGGMVNYSIYAVLISYGAPFTDYPILAVAAGAVSGLAFNFTGSKILVFR